jgi:hypothetical protein
MSNVSGIEDNRVFRANFEKGELYYYIDAQLNLSGEVIPVYQPSSAGKYRVYYFNVENNLNYLKVPNKDEYSGFIKVEPNAVIGDVVVYLNPDGDIDPDVRFEIGGIYKPSIEMNYSLLNDYIDLWAGPTGNVPGEIFAGEAQDAQVCQYNQSPVGFLNSGPYQSSPIKYLGLIVYNESGVPVELNANIHVVIKVYPKFQ